MALTDILFNAAGGGVIGSLLHFGTGILETWRKKKDAEIEIMLMHAKTESAEKAAAWDAFARSQQSQAPFSVPMGVSPFMANVFTAVEAFKGFTRPGLTWALLAVLIYVFSVSSESARQQMLGEITFGAFTALFWYFGSRYSTKR